MKGNSADGPPLSSSTALTAEGANLCTSLGALPALGDLLATDLFDSILCAAKVLSNLAAHSGVLDAGPRLGLGPQCLSFPFFSFPLFLFFIFFSLLLILCLLLFFFFVFFWIFLS
jgi:hypothetical protein